MKGLFYITCVVVGASLPATSLADDTHVETVASFEDARLPSGFSTRVKATDAFEDGSDLARALQFIPGLYIRRQSSFGQSAFVTVRGSNARQIAVSLDGQRISSPFGPGFDLGTFAAAGIDTIDVHRGAPAVSKGSGALSGAINLQTGTRDLPGWSTQATSLAGSWDTYGVSASGDIANSTTAGRLTASWRQSEGDFPFLDSQAAPLERTNNDVTTGSALGTVEHRFGRANRVKATVNFQSSDRGIAGPSEFQQTFQSARLEDQRVFGTLRIDERDVLKEPGVALDLYQSVGAQGRHADYENENTLLGSGAFESSADFLTFNGAAGGLLFWPSVNNISHFDVDIRGESLAGDKTSGDPIDANRLTMGLGVSDEVFFGDELLSLNGGLRVESIQGSFDEVGVMPSAGAILRPWKPLQVKSSVARTFRAPDFDELYLDIETLRGNPELESERAWVWDAGVILFGESGDWRGQLEAVYFESHVDALIAFIPVSSYVVEATNLLGVTSRGAEFLGTTGLGPVDLTLGYTFTHSRGEETPDIQAPNQPLHRGMSRIEWMILRRVRGAHALSVSGDISAQTQTNLDRFGNITNPAYATVDAGIGYSPVSWARLVLNAYNLADRRDIVDGLQRPLPGRSFYGSLTLTTGSP